MDRIKTMERVVVMEFMALLMQLIIARKLGLHLLAGASWAASLPE